MLDLLCLHGSVAGGSQRERTPHPRADQRALSNMYMIFIYESFLCVIFFFKKEKERKVYRIVRKILEKICFLMFMVTLINESA